MHDCLMCCSFCAQSDVSLAEEGLSLVLAVVIDWQSFLMFSAGSQRVHT